MLTSGTAARSARTRSRYCAAVYPRRMAREHAVGAGLGRQVHVLAHAGQPGDGGDEVVAEVLGVRGHEADALEAGDRVQARAAARRSAARPPLPRAAGRARRR